MEQWRDHPTYRIKVSDHGNIRGTSGINRKFRFNRGGYWRLNVAHEKKIVTLNVHQLVAEVWLNKVEGLTVNHKDGNKLNNRVDNLEYITGEENTTKAFRGGLVGTCIPVLGYYSKREAERQTGLNRKHI